MNKLFLSFIIFPLFVFSQETNIKQGFTSEQFPIFPGCENLQAKKLENCFYKEVQDFVYANFEIPADLKQNNYKGEVKVLFEVDANGEFKVIYVNTANDAIVE